MMKQNLWQWSELWIGERNNEWIIPWKKLVGKKMKTFVQTTAINEKASKKERKIKLKEI